MSAREFLVSRLLDFSKTYFGKVNPARSEFVADSWMDDRNSPLVVSRFAEIEKFSEQKPRKILDMASGCGTAVYYGLLNGYDMYGIEPEAWKHDYNAMKAAENGYPPEWQTRFCIGVGETMPYPDNAFDCVTSHQTLEHVQNLDHCIEEMLRVTRPGGMIQIHCPDYLGTFENHYQLPWLPLFPRPLARLYLRWMGRPTLGLETLQYTTKGRIRRIIRRVEREYGWKTRMVDLHAHEFEVALKRRSIPNLPGLYVVARLRRALRRLFRTGETLNLLVYVVEK